MQTNYTGVVSVGIPLAQRLETQGHGTLVLLSSVAGERVRKANFVYGSSKAGADGFFQGLGDRLVGSGVHVMIVRPGFVRTKMTAGMKDAPLSTTPEVVATAVATRSRATARSSGCRRRCGGSWPCCATPPPHLPPPADLIRRNERRAEARLTTHRADGERSECDHENRRGVRLRRDVDAARHARAVPARGCGTGALLRALAADAPRLVLAGMGAASRDDAKERMLRRLVGGRSHADLAPAGTTTGEGSRRPVCVRR